MNIFQKIIAGQIPCHKIYEDAHVLAFLDIQPLSPGHSLLIPKEAAETVDKLSEEAAGALGRALPKVCLAVMRATGTSDYNILQKNGRGAHQEIPHVHFHIIPKPSREQGLHFEWHPGNLGGEEGKVLAASIAAEIPGAKAPK